MIVVIRTDAGAAIGAGHVMRCLTLADELAKRGARVLFISREHRGHLADLVHDRGHHISLLPSVGALDRDPESWLGASIDQDAQETLNALSQLRITQVDWLVVDHYGIDARWHVQVRAKADRIMVIDDLADRPLDTDLLLDQNFGAERRPYETVLRRSGIKLLGPRFSLLAPEFLEARERRALRKTPPADHAAVLVLLGGTDPDDVTSVVLDLFHEQLQQAGSVEVVIGRSHPNPDAVRARCRRLRHARLHVDSRDVASLLEHTDLAIGAGGTANWERLCVGVPTLALPIAPNQEAILIDLARAGLVASHTLNDPSALQQTFGVLLQDQEWRASLSAKGRLVVDGLGTARVAKHMMDAPRGRETVPFRV